MKEDAVIRLPQQTPRWLHNGRVDITGCIVIDYRVGIAETL